LIKFDLFWFRFCCSGSRDGPKGAKSGMGSFRNLRICVICEICGSSFRPCPCNLVTNHSFNPFPVSSVAGNVRVFHISTTWRPWSLCEERPSLPRRYQTPKLLAKKKTETTENCLMCIAARKPPVCSHAIKCTPEGAGILKARRVVLPGAIVKPAKFGLRRHDVALAAPFENHSRGFNPALALHREAKAETCLRSPRLTRPYRNAVSIKGRQ
jgi:hypothetical protein